MSIKSCICEAIDGIAICLVVVTFLIGLVIVVLSGFGWTADLLGGFLPGDLNEAPSVPPQNASTVRIGDHEMSFITDCNREDRLLSPRELAYTCIYLSKSDQSIPLSDLQHYTTPSSATPVIIVKWEPLFESNTTYQNLTAGELHATNAEGISGGRFEGDFEIRAPHPAGYYRLTISINPNLSPTFWRHEMKQHRIDIYEPGVITNYLFQLISLPFQLLVYLGILIASAQVLLAVCNDE